jgi:hypothetical protein
VSGHDHDQVLQRGASAPGGGLVSLGALLASVGLGLFAFLLFGDDPGRAWRMFLINFLFFTGIAMGGILFVAIHKVTKARWAGPIIRFAEAGVAFLPIALLCFFVLFLGRDHLFPWIEHPTPARGRWLTTSWVFWRDLAALLALFGTSIAFVRTNLKPDLHHFKDQVGGWRRAMYDRVLGDYSGSAEDEAAVDRRLTRLGPVVIVLYAYMLSIIAFDLVMSLAPYWLSNLFGAFFFIGAFLTGLTTLGVLMVYWRGKLQMGDLIGRQQFHDLGKLIFGFSVFWAYLMYSQLLVIWYGNLREETSFVFFRLWGEWQPIAILVGLMVFLIPFWGLIWVKAKITPITFMVFVIISLLGVWLERYLLVQPSLVESPVFGLPELGISVGFLGLFILAHGLFARTFPMVSPRWVTRTLEMGGH